MKRKPLSNTMKAQKNLAGGTARREEEKKTEEREKCTNTSPVLRMYILGKGFPPLKERALGFI